nr:uncharacterized protein LOC109159386 [Ipomoea trifida]
MGGSWMFQFPGKSSQSPIFKFYIAILINGEIIILISIYHKEAYAKTKARSTGNGQALVLKREHVYGGKLHTTKANFGGKREVHPYRLLGRRRRPEPYFLLGRPKGAANQAPQVEIQRQRKEWKWKIRNDVDEEGVVEELEKLVIIIVGDVKLSSVMEWESIEENEIRGENRDEIRGENGDAVGDEIENQFGNEVRDENKREVGDQVEDENEGEI